VGPTRPSNQPNIGVGYDIGGMKGKKQDEHDFFGRVWSGSNLESIVSLSYVGFLGDDMFSFALSRVHWDPGGVPG